MNRRLKIIFITLLIVLISIISFVGLFVQDTKFMKNLLPDYQIGMDLEGYRAVTVNVSDESETIYYDKDGNRVEEEEEDGTKEEIPANPEEVLTKENYLKSKEIVQNRLSNYNVSEYFIRLNESNGSMTVELPEDYGTDDAVQLVYTRGRFTIEDEAGNVLMDGSDIDEVTVSYGADLETGSTGTAVYLTFIFKEESADKFKDITNTYITTTNEDGEEEDKNVVIKIDDSTLLSTTFEEEISNGTLPLTLGTATSNESLSEYIRQASNIAVLLNSGELPIEYTVEQNRFVKSDLGINDLIVPGIVLGVILIIAFVVLIAKYKSLGLLGIISYIGYIAVLLIIIRFTNVVITLEGIIGLLTSAILNFILVTYLLHCLKNKEKNIVEYKNGFNKSMMSALFVLIPTIIIGIVLCFSSWLPIFSFGMIMFWGILTMVVYNAIVTRILFLNSLKNKE